MVTCTKPLPPSHLLPVSFVRYDIALCFLIQKRDERVSQPLVQIFETGVDAVSLSHGFTEEPVLCVVGKDGQRLEALLDVVRGQIILFLVLILREDVRRPQIPFLFPFPLQRTVLLREEARHL